MPTVALETAEISYTGDGDTGPFSVPFYFLEDSHLKVIRETIATGAQETLTLTTEYTVDGDGDQDGGTVTLVTSISSDYKLHILRDVPITQEAAYPRNDPFPAATHERVANKLTMIAQQLKEAIDRAPKLPPGTGLAGDTFALPIPGAGQYLRWNAGGTALETAAAVYDLGNFLQSGAGAVSRTATSKIAEIEVSITDFLAVGNGNPANATANSTAIQAAIDYVKFTLGGGRVRFPATGATTEYCTDAPIIVWSKVSIYIDSGVTIRKTTDTPSSIEAAAGLPQYTLTPFGFPICVFHLVEIVDGVSLTYADADFVCKGIITGDTDDPNTTVVDFGIFCHGAVQAEIDFTGSIENVKYGFVQYGSAIVACNIHGRVNRVFGGYYSHYATMTKYDNLYIGKFRDFGQIYSSMLYSHVQHVTSEQGGYRALFPDTTTDGMPSSVTNIGGAVAFVINACQKCVFELAGEEHIGTALAIRSTQHCEVSSLFTTRSDYTGSRRVAAAFMVDNYDLKFNNNRMIFNTAPIVGVSSDPVKHWNYLIDSLFGRFEMEGNRYINAGTSVAESGEGYVYVSGENGQGIVPFSFTPSYSAATPGDLAVGSPGNSNGTYSRKGREITFSLDVQYTPTWTTASGALRITGLPQLCGPIDGVASIGVMSDGVDWSNNKTMLTAVIIAGTNYIHIYQHEDAVQSVELPMSTLTSGQFLRFIITGSYLMAP